MAVNDAGHDEFPAQVCDFAFIFGKACLIAHIDKPAVLHRKGRRLRVLFVRCEDFCISKKHICFHNYIFFPPKYTSAGLLRLKPSFSAVRRLLSNTRKSASLPAVMEPL